MKINPEIRERIINTANTLLAESNKEPTNANVLERMGKGSLSHVSPVMREWRQSRKEEATAALKIPPDLKKVIESSVGQVWSVASKLASATVENSRQEAKEAIEAATIERDEALNEIIRLENRVTELKKALADKDQAITHTHETINSVRTQVVRLTSDNAALLARLDDKDEQIRNLAAEIKAVREDNKTLQSELVDIARGHGGD